MASTFSKTLLALGAFTLGAATFTATDAEARPNRAQAAHAEQGPQHKHRGGKAMKFIRAVERLDLNADQQATIDQIKADIEADRGERDGRKGKKRERMEGILDGTVSAADLHAQVDARADKMAARGHEDVDRIMEIVSILTPAQKDELKGMIAQRGERRGQGREGRGGRGGQGQGHGQGYGKRGR